MWFSPLDISFQIKVLDGEKKSLFSNCSLFLGIPAQKGNTDTLWRSVGSHDRTLNLQGWEFVSKVVRTIGFLTSYILDHLIGGPV